MTRLEQIKNTITANGMLEWTDERVSQAMREYADQQTAELRAADECKDIAVDAYESITSIEIELI